MKNKVVVAILALTATFVFAGVARGEESPLLRKTMSIGFVSPAEQTNVTCQIFADRVETAKQAGSLSASIVTNVKLDADAVNKQIAEAAKGKITKKAAPSNEPLVRYQALHNGKTVNLKSMGSEILDNTSDAALTLTNFIDHLCD